MNVLICDDEQYAVRKLEGVIKEVINDCSVDSFSFPSDAIKGVKCLIEKGRLYKYAFLDIEMPEMNGICLAKRIKEIQPQINIIFVTGYTDYALDAFSVYAKGYLLKPITKEKLEVVIKELEINNVNDIATRLEVKAFGNFEVYNNGKAIMFTRAKAKELFAYLIDRNGAGVSSRELASVLWPDKLFSISVKSNISQCIASLEKDLKKAGVDVNNILIRKRNSIAVNVDNIKCDYFDLMNNKSDAEQSYHGEYMTNYEWAEFTLGNIERYIFNKNI